MDANPQGPDDPDVPPPPVAPPRRSLFDRPLFWLGLVGIGVVLAVALSFAVERTNLSGSVGDVGHYCQQVRSVQQLTSLGSAGSMSSTTDALTRAQALVANLTALEAVAPDPVHDDVTTVRQSAQALVTALTDYQQGSPTQRAAALTAAARAAASGQDAVNRMGEYTQEACGIDLGATDTTPTTAPAPPTTR